MPPHGYPGVLYRGKYAYEHHVVWWRKSGEAVPAGKVVHHLNHVKTDNSPDNLELMDKREHNREHANELAERGISFKRMEGPAEEKRGRRKLTEDIVREIRASHASGKSGYGLAKEHGLHISTVQALLQRKTWRHVA